jgi:hypothetical protein
MDESSVTTPGPILFTGNAESSLPTYTDNGLKFTSPNWCAELQHHGRRPKLSLETPNEEAAATI